MRTDELIDSLANRIAPVEPRSVPRALAYCALTGIGASLLMLALFYGVRADLRIAILSASFWMKWAYAFALAWAGYALCERLARPGAATRWRAWLPIAPTLLLALIAVIDIAALSPSARRSAWLGHSALVCPWSIGLLSLPLFAALCWALRRAAPTRLRAAGCAAGLLAGALAAAVYGLYCVESSTAFVATWYTLGILLPTLIGALFGPRLLRWR